MVKFVLHDFTCHYQNLSQATWSSFISCYCVTVVLYVRLRNFVSHTYIEGLWERGAEDNT